MLTNLDYKILLLNACLVSSCFAMKRAHEDGETGIMQMEESSDESSFTDESSKVNDPNTLKSRIVKWLTEHADDFVTFLEENEALPNDLLLLLIEHYVKELPKDSERAEWNNQRFKLALYCINKSLKEYKDKYKDNPDLLNFLYQQKHTCLFAKLAVKIADALVEDEYYEDRLITQPFTQLLLELLKEGKADPKKMALLEYWRLHLNQQYLRRTVCQFMVSNSEAAWRVFRLVEERLDDNELYLVYQWAKILGCDEVRDIIARKLPDGEPKDLKGCRFVGETVLDAQDPLMRSLLRGDPDVLERIQSAGKSLWNTELYFTLDSANMVGLVEFLAYAGYSTLARSELILKELDQHAITDVWPDWEKPIEAAEAAADQGHVNLFQYAWPVHWVGDHINWDSESAIRFGYKRVILAMQLSSEDLNTAFAYALEYDRFDMAQFIMEHCFEEYHGEGICDMFFTLCNETENDLFRYILFKKKKPYIMAWLRNPTPAFAEFDGELTCPSPLLIATLCYNPDLDIIKSLLQYGAEDYPDEKGMTALRSAREKGLTEIEKLISDQAEKKKRDEGSSVTQIAKKPRKGDRL